jgi:hypothetical protein
MIRYKRGKIQVIDLEGLKESACECYDTVNARYDELFAHHRRSGG